MVHSFIMSHKCLKYELLVVIVRYAQSRDRTIVSVTGSHGDDGGGI